MGFNKFKHLPKQEACECIRDHLLPQRATDDIKRQLVYITNSEHRQASLKELLAKQKQQPKSANYDFDKKVHYKSPLEQADFHAHLPSMYTVNHRFKKLTYHILKTKYEKVSLILTLTHNEFVHWYTSENLILFVSFQMPDFLSGYSLVSFTCYKIISSISLNNLSCI